MFARAAISAVVLSVLTASAFLAGGAQQDKKPDQVSSGDFEAILTELKVPFKKRPMTGSKDRFLFDY